MSFKIQELSIPDSFRIIKNDFTTYNPEIEYSEERSLYYLKEDLLQLRLKGSNLLIDLGWYGDFETNEGEFKIYVIKDFKWESPLIIESEISQIDITIKLEQILLKII